MSRWRGMWCGLEVQFFLWGGKLGSHKENLVHTPLQSSSRGRFWAGEPLFQIQIQGPTYACPNTTVTDWTRNSTDTETCSHKHEQEFGEAFWHQTHPMFCFWSSAVAIPLEPLFWAWPSSLPGRGIPRWHRHEPWFGWLSHRQCCLAGYEKHTDFLAQDNSQSLAGQMFACTLKSEWPISMTICSCLYLCVSRN